MSAASLRNPHTSEEAIRSPLLASSTGGEADRREEDEQHSMPTKTSLVINNIAGNGRAIFTQASLMLLTFEQLLEKKHRLMCGHHQNDPTDWMPTSSRHGYGGRRSESCRYDCACTVFARFNVQYIHTDSAKSPGLFSYHPPLQSLAILLFVQGILTLQPTSTKADKARGLAIHQIFQIAGLLASA